MSTAQKTSQFNSGSIKSGKSASATKTNLRRLLVLICAIGLGWVSWFMLDRILVDRSPIIVGILHSQTGPMAVSEQTMIDAEILALEEINAAGEFGVTATTTGADCLADIPAGYLRHLI